MRSQERNVRPTAEAANILCPHCRRHTARRWPRSSPLERAASLAYLYPFRCEAGHRRFHAFRWGKRYTRVERDRRAHERIDTSIPAAVLVNGHGVDGVVTSLSLGGCGVTTEAPLAIGDVVRLDIAAAGDAPLVIDVAMVRSIQVPVIGLEFVRIQPGHARRLGGLLARLRTTVDARRSARRHPTTRRKLDALLRLLATLGFTAISALALAAVNAGLAR